jgi:hypothetical protein
LHLVIVERSDEMTRVLSVVLQILDDFRGQHRGLILDIEAEVEAIGPPAFPPKLTASD